MIPSYTDTFPHLSVTHGHSARQVYALDGRAVRGRRTSKQTFVRHRRTYYANCLCITHDNMYNLHVQMTVKFVYNFIQKMFAKYS
nr:MAG TPA: hypothetical protein [Caudoviricetes sp.]